MLVSLPIFTVKVVFWAMNNSFGNIGVNQRLVPINITMNATTFKAIPVINFIKKKNKKVQDNSIFLVKLPYLWF